MPLEPHPTDSDKLIYKSRKYNLPKPWQGLTDEERKDIFKACGVGDRGYVTAMVEAKLKEKNT